MDPPKFSKLPEIHLKLNDLAVYNGVLVPESNYRIYRSNEELVTVLEKSFTPPEPCPKCTVNIWVSVSIFALGVAAGVLLVDRAAQRP